MFVDQKCWLLSFPIRKYPNNKKCACIANHVICTLYMLKTCQHVRFFFHIYCYVTLCPLPPCRVSIHHVEVNPKIALLNMLKRLDKIRHRGQKRDEFLDLVESPNTSDTEGSDDLLVKPRPSLKDMEDIRDPVSVPIAFETCSHSSPFHACTCNWVTQVCSGVITSFMTFCPECTCNSSHGWF